MSMSDFKLQAGLNIDDSATLIQKDLPSLEKKVNQGGPHIKLQVGLQDITNSKVIQKQIASIGRTIPPVLLRVKVDDHSLTAEIDRIKRSFNLGPTVTPDIAKLRQQSIDSIDQLKKSYKSNNLTKQNSYKKLLELESTVPFLQSKEAFRLVESSLKSINQELFKMTHVSHDALKFEADVSNFSVLQNKLHTVGKISDEAQAKILKINKAIGILSKIPNGGTLTPGRVNVKNIFDKNLQSFKSLVNSTVSAHRQEIYDEKIVRRKSDARNKLNTFVSGNPRVLEDASFAQQYANIVDSMGPKNIQPTAAAMEKLNREVNTFIAGAKKAGLTEKTLSDRISKTVRNLSVFAVLSMLGISARDALQTMVSNVVSLDAAMTELRKVTDETETTYQSFFKNATDSAKNMGATIRDVITSTADFARLGFSIGEASQLAEAAIIYKNVGDGIEDITVASESIISTMKAFGIEAADAMGIVDRFNEVGNNFAISSSGIGEALKRSASALAAAGSTIDESIALAVAANRTVQDPNKVGTALKTMSLRIRGAKVELESMGESVEGMAVSTAKLREEIKLLTGNKVDIMLDEQTFKTPYKILQEIAKVWNDISNVDQSALLELLAGKQQANIIASILTGFSDAEQALITAENSVGSASKENEKYLESLNGRISILKANYESLSSNVVNSDFLKGIIDFGSDAIGVLDTLTGLLDTTSILIGGLSGIGITAMVDDLSKGKIDRKEDFFYNILDEMRLDPTNKLNALKSQATAQLNNDLNALKQYKDNYKKMQDGSYDFASLWAGMSEPAKTFIDSIEQSGQGIDNFDDKVKNFEDSQKRMINSMNTTTTGAKVLKGALKGLIGIAGGLAAAFAGHVFALGVEWLWKNVLTTQAATEKLKEYRKEIDSFATNSGQFEELSQRFAALSQKTKLSADELKEYTKVQNEMKSILPQLQGYYDSQNNFIVTESIYVNELTAKYRELLNAKRRANAETYMENGIFRLSKYTEDNEAANLPKLKLKKAQQYIELYNKKQAGTASSDELTRLKWFELLGYDIESANADLVAATQKIEQLRTDRVTILKDMILGSGAFSNQKEEDAISQVVSHLSFDKAGEYLQSIYKSPDGGKTEIGNIKNLPAYQDLISGRMDNMTSQEKGLIVQLGGIDEANKALQEYKDNQSSIINGSYEFGNTLTAENLRVVESLYKLKDAATLPLPDATPLIDQQKLLVNTFDDVNNALSKVGKAYSDYLEKGKLSFENLGELQSLFGGLDSYKEFMEILASGDMSLQSFKNSLSAMVTEFLLSQDAISGVNEETIGLLESLLESAGVTNASTVAMEALAVAQDKLAAEKLMAANDDFANMTAEEINQLLTETNASNYAAAMVNYLALQKRIASNADLVNMTGQEIDALQELAKSAGYTGAALAAMGRIQYNAQIIENKYTSDDAKKKAQAEIDLVRNNMPKPGDFSIDFSGLAANVSGATGNIKSEFDKLYDELQYMRDRGIIDEQEYLNRLYALNEQYNKDNLEQWRKYDLEIYKGRIDLLQKQAEAFKRKALEEIDEDIKALQDRKEEVSKYYDDLIQAEQKKLDKLKEEWTQQDKLLRIEQARANLEKVQSQKNVHIYRDGQGFVWEADQEAVNGAQDELDQAIKDHDRYLEELAIQNRIDRLEQQKDQAIEALDEEIEALQEWREKWEESLDMEEDFGEFEDLLEQLKDFESMNFEERKALLDAFVEHYRAQMAELKAIAAEMASIDFDSGSSSGSSGSKGNKKPGKKPSKNDPGNKTDYWGNKVNNWGGSDDKGNWRPSYDQNYADGTLSVPKTGMYLTDELGPEIKIPGVGMFTKLRYGDAVIPADISKNLWEMGKNPMNLIRSAANLVNKTKQQAVNTYQVSFGDLTLPNVRNASDFVNELKGIISKAEQWSYKSV